MFSVLISIIMLVVIFILSMWRRGTAKKGGCGDTAGSDTPPSTAHKCPIDTNLNLANMSPIIIRPGLNGVDNETHGDLYITDELTAKCSHIRGILKVDSILSITQRAEENYQDFRGEHMHIMLDDLPTATIDVHFDRANAFIDSQLSRGKNLIVHCMAGISRSVSLVMSYLMHKYALSYEQALGLIRKTRPIACPNEGFRRQLLKKYNYTGLGEIVKGIGVYN